MQSKVYKMYSLKNPITNEIRYIGITSVRLNARLSQHIYTGKNERKRNTPVSKWIYSLLKQDLKPVIELLDICEEVDWEWIEKYWIEQFKQWGFRLLNLREGGTGIITSEQRRKDGLQRSAEGHYIKIVRLDTSGNLIKIYNSIKEASIELDVVDSAIGNSISGRSALCANSYWVHLDKYNSGNYILRKPMEFGEHSRTKVYCYDLNFNLIKIFDSLSLVKEFIYKNKRSNSDGLMKAINNKTSWKNYFFSYISIINKEDYTIIEKFHLEEYDENNKVIEKFTSLKEAGKKFNLDTSTMCQYCKNNTRTKNNTFIRKINKN